MDKLFLLTYTCVKEDGVRHLCHAWFETEDEMREFVKRMRGSGGAFETDISIEILQYRDIELQA